MQLQRLLILEECNLEVPQNILKTPWAQTWAFAQVFWKITVIYPLQKEVSNNAFSIRFLFDYRDYRDLCCYSHILFSRKCKEHFCMFYIPNMNKTSIALVLERLESRQNQRSKNGKTSAASKRSNGKSSALKSSRKSLQSRGSISLKWYGIMY